jgi:hypothetical protein
VAEHVEHPPGTRRRAEHVALEAEAQDDVADRAFQARQVGVGLVVHSADELQPPCREEPAQLGPILRVDVPVRLEVVQLGEDELVVGVPTCLVEVYAHQVERGGLAGFARVLCDLRLIVPSGQITGLGVPPERVVVEVRNHEHRPPWRRDRQLRGAVHPPARRLRDHRHREAVALGVCGVDRARHLDLVFLTGHEVGDDRFRSAHTVAVDPDGDRPTVA